MKRKPVISTKMIDPNHLMMKYRKSRGFVSVSHFRKTAWNESISRKNLHEWFDYDIINNTVEIRHRQAGDVLAINKNGGTQRLKKYFINEKIPKAQRDEILLLADGSHVVWVSDTE